VQAAKKTDYFVKHLMYLILALSLQFFTHQFVTVLRHVDGRLHAVIHKVHECGISCFLEGDIVVKAVQD